MTDTFETPVLPSGLLDFSARRVDDVPESPGHYRLRSSGQCVLYVGYAGDEGLREQLGAILASNALSGIGSFEFESADSAAAARQRAAEEVRTLKPLYNEGYGRFRNSETHLPKRAHSVRRAARNP